MQTLSPVPMEEDGPELPCKLDRNIRRWEERPDCEYRFAAELRRLEGTLAGKEWFVPISWNDKGVMREGQDPGR